MKNSDKATCAEGMAKNVKNFNKAETFEQSLERLTSIVERVESAQTPLDEAIALYKSGLKLAEKCDKTLSRYEEEVLTLSGGEIK